MAALPTDRRMQRALLGGDIAAVRRALDLGASPDSLVSLTPQECARRGTHSTSALGVALLRKQWDVAQMLLSLGADPWASPAVRAASTQSPLYYSSAWEALAVEGGPEDDEAIQWLVERRPGDVLPVTIRGRRSLWDMLAARASPEALLHAINGYRLDESGPLELALHGRLVDMAIAKGGGGSYEGEWIKVLDGLMRIAPGVASPSYLLGLGSVAVARGNSAACLWVIRRIGVPWKSPVEGDPGWALAREVAAWGHGGRMLEELGGVADEACWQLLICAAGSTPEGFLGVLKASSANQDRIVREPGPVLASILAPRGGNVRYRDFRALLGIMVDAGCDIGGVLEDGATPFRMLATLCSHRHYLRKPIPPSTLVPLANALLRAGVPLLAEEASLLRPWLPASWMDRQWARKLAAALPAGPSGPRRSARF